LLDFSDTITNRRKFGYRIDSDAYEWVNKLMTNLIMIFILNIKKNRILNQLKLLYKDLNVSNVN